MKIEVHKNKRAMLIIVILILICGGLIYMSSENITGEAVKDSNTVLLKTNMGEIKIKLYDDMPITTGNLKKLVKDGTYNGVIFHRVIDGFMIQGGDPTGTGRGDLSIPDIQDEFTHEGGNKNNRGTISMANAGPNTGSSQFFINLVDNNFLDSKHPVFGEVIEGMDVVDSIAKVKTGANDKPVEDVVIEKAILI